MDTHLPHTNRVLQTNMKSTHKVLQLVDPTTIRKYGRWLRLATVAFVISFMWVPLAAAQEKRPPDPLFDRGKALVSHNCGRCHAVESSGESPHSEAPPFRDLLQRYPIDALEESFMDEIYSQHPDMPVFKVTPDQLDAILYFIAVIQKD